MILKNISAREKLIFLVTFIVILAGVCYNFLVEPYRKRINKLNEEISENQIELRKIEKLLLEKDQILEVYDTYAKDARVKAATDEEAVANFLSKVESLARSSSVLINDVKPKPVKDFGEYKRFNFSLEVEGTMDNITKLIYELEKSPEAIRIERLQISVKTGRTDTLKAEMAIAKLAMP